MRLPLTVRIEILHPREAAEESVGLPQVDLGDALSFRVVCESHGAGTVPAARALLRYRCHGSGTPEVVDVAVADLAGGPVSQERPLELAGAVEVPAGGPASYCGEHVKIDWFLTVPSIEGLWDEASEPFLARPPRLARDRG